MKQYLNLLNDIMKNGVDRSDRTGTGTRSVFGRQMRFDLSKSFPLLTTKKVFFKGVAYELLWFIKGDTNIKYLLDHGVHIWDEWADKNGDLGPVYGSQWRNFGADGLRYSHVQVTEFSPDGKPFKATENKGQVWGSQGIDQLGNVIQSIKKNPDSRRHLVVAWNPIELPLMALPPCHCLFQFYVANGKLSCQLYQRSCDVFLGLPFNIASYSLLTHMIAKVCDLNVGEFVWTGGDIHIYHNHFNQVKTQLERKPRRLPTLVINKKNKIEEYDYDDFRIDNYNPYPVIKAPIAV